MARISGAHPAPFTRVVTVLGTVVTAAFLVGSGAASLIAQHALALDLPPSTDARAPAARAAVPYDPDRVIASGLFLPWPEEDDIALPVTDGTTVASCGADVRLVGLFVMRADPPRGFAAVRTESGGRLVATGSELGERHVVAIERDRAVLEDGSGLRCELRLFEGGAERPVTVGAAVPRLATPPTSDVVERISDTEYRVSPAALSDLGPLLRSVAAVPSDEGLRLYGIRGTSPLAAADLRNGDTIVEIDGHPASDVNHALEAAARGQRGEPIRIVVERHGQRSERTYSLGSARD